MVQTAGSQKAETSSYHSGLTYSQLQLLIISKNCLLQVYEQKHVMPKLTFLPNIGSSLSWYPIQLKTITTLITMNVLIYIKKLCTSTSICSLNAT